MMKNIIYKYIYNSFFKIIIHFIIKLDQNNEVSYGIIKLKE